MELKVIVVETSRKNAVGVGRFEMCVTEVFGLEGK